MLLALRWDQTVTVVVSRSVQKQFLNIIASISCPISSPWCLGDICSYRGYLYFTGFDQRSPSDWLQCKHSFWESLYETWVTIICLFVLPFVCLYCPSVCNCTCLPTCIVFSFVCFSSSLCSHYSTIHVYMYISVCLHNVWHSAEDANSFSATHTFYSNKLQIPSALHAFSLLSTEP